MLSQITNYSKYTRHYQPRHSLAQYTIAQIDRLEQRPQDIIRAMGYPLKHTIPACDRLRHVLSNRHLGLDGSYIDAYFTADEFLEALLLVLDIHYEPFQDDIAKIRYDLAHYPNPLPTYTLRADINFDFNGANWMSRGGASRLANVRLPDEFAKLNDSERHSVIHECITKHYEKYDGHLPYDGIIAGYCLITEQSNEVIDRMAYELPKSKQCF